MTSHNIIQTTGTDKNHLSKIAIQSSNHFVLFKNENKWKVNESESQKTVKNRRIATVLLTTVDSMLINSIQSRQ